MSHHTTTISTVRRDRALWVQCPWIVTSYSTVCLWCQYLAGSASRHSAPIAKAICTRLQRNPCRMVVERPTRKLLYTVAALAANGNTQVQLRWPCGIMIAAAISVTTTLRYPTKRARAGGR